MAVSLRYPVYIVASRDGVIVVNTDGDDCILLFHSAELAEQQTDRIQASHPQLGSLYALPVPNEEALAEGLRELPRNVSCAVWDPTGTTAKFNQVCLEDLLVTLRG